MGLNKYEEDYARLAEAPDVKPLMEEVRKYSQETYFHLARVGYLTEMLYDISKLPLEIKDEVIKGALLHDVGKLKVPLEVLHKEGKFTPEERDIMDMHSIHAIPYLMNASQIVRDIALLHHNNADEVPNYVAYVTAIDIYVALQQPRAYKGCFDDKKIMNIINENVSNGKITSYYAEILNIHHIIDLLEDDDDE